MTVNAKGEQPITGLLPFVLLEPPIRFELMAFSLRVRSFTVSRPLFSGIISDLAGYDTP